MKNNFYALKLLFFLLLFVAVSFPESAQAQDCSSSFYQMKEGASFTLTSYNTRNKPVSKSKHTYSKVNNMGNGLSALIKQNIFNSRDKPIDNASYEITCVNGAIKLNMQDMIAANLHLQDSTVKVELSGDVMELPANIKVGQHLKDATMHIKAIMGQGIVLDQRMKIKYRKVDSKETVETPAGRFDSFKVSYMLEMTGQDGKPRTMKTVAWYAVGPGMVKTESYNSKGKLTGYTLLTEFSE